MTLGHSLICKLVHGIVFATVVAIAPAFADFGNEPTNNTWPPLSDVSESQSNLMQANYYIVFDGSGSMRSWNCARSEKLPLAQRALQRFVRRIPVTANIGLLAFDRFGTSERIGLGEGTRSDVFASIEKIQAYGETPLADALTLGYRALTTQAARQLGYGEYHLVVVTDGRASKGQSPQQLVSSMLGESPIVLHTIGLCVEGNHSLNQPRRSYFTRARDTKSLDSALDQVLAEEPAFQLFRFSDRKVSR